MAIYGISFLDARRLYINTANTMEMGGGVSWEEKLASDFFLASITKYD